MKFGATNATSYTVVSNTSITAVSPSGTGTVDMTVTNGGLTSSTSASDQCHLRGGTDGDINLAVVGSDGWRDDRDNRRHRIHRRDKRDDRRHGSDRGYTVASATSITATTPSGTAGTASVAVTTVGGTGTGTNLYTYVAAPTVTAIAPRCGSDCGRHDGDDHGDESDGRDGGGAGRNRGDERDGAERNVGVGNDPSEDRGHGGRGGDDARRHWDRHRPIHIRGGAGR